MNNFSQEAMTFTPAAPPPKGVEANLEDPDKTAQTWDFVTQSLCLIFMTIFFGLRTYVKLSILRGFGIEDCESLMRLYAIGKLVLFANLSCRDLSGSLRMARHSLKDEMLLMGIYLDTGNGIFHYSHDQLVSSLPRNLT